VLLIVSSGGIESPSMLLCDGHDDILIRVDRIRKLVAQHLDEVESGKLLKRKRSYVW